MFTAADRADWHESIFFCIIMDWIFTKWQIQAFADANSNAAKFVISLHENIVGKGENASYRDFFLFSAMFPKRLLPQGR